MFKRCLPHPFSLVLLIVFALLAVGPARADVVVVADHDTLKAAISDTPPCSLIVISQLTQLFSYVPFAGNYVLGPNNVGTKIMAVPGEVAIFAPPAGDAFSIPAGVTDVVLENLVITGPQSSIGVNVKGPNASVKIINCQIMCWSTGVSASAGGLVEIEGSKILRNVTGVDLLSTLEASTKATVENTQIRNNLRIGVSMRAQTPNFRGSAKIWHCMIDKNGSDGVHIAAHNTAVLNNNDVSYNGGNGILFEDGSFGSVSFNTVTHNAAAGIANLAGAASFNAAPGNNTIAGNAPNVIGVPPASNQIGPF